MKNNLKKHKSGSFVTSSVNWGSKIINLDTEDLVFTEKMKKIYQYPISHEFGHTIGNSSYIKNMHADEYKVSSKFNLDYASRMNAGNELRKRHLDYIITQLNNMIPNTKFSIDSLK